jgi:Protein of unknown function (DUF3891)
MVLHPVPSDRPVQPQHSPIPAWQAVEQTQKQSAREWWVITQADHAVLAGDLAARLEFPSIPAVSDEVVRAISLHDAGWDRLEAAENADAMAAHLLRRPRSFLDVGPTDFLIAWSGSIAAAERNGAVGGIIVSEHFSRLARTRLASRNDAPEDVRQLQEFLTNEAQRQSPLRAQAPVSTSELQVWTDILQFCDLVSLYLCCGTHQAVEFPQQFGETLIRVRRQGDVFVFTPPVFGRGMALGVSARRYPTEIQSETLPFLLI